MEREKLFRILTHQLSLGRLSARKRDRLRALRFRASSHRFLRGDQSLLLVTVLTLDIMTQQQRSTWVRRFFLFLTPLVLGMGLLTLAARLRAAPERRVVEEVAQPLRVITARSVPVIPRAIGLGESQPKRLWQAVCEVKGQIVEVHPQLRAGSTIANDEVLLRIDDTDVQLAVSRLNAEIARAQASLSELSANEANYRESLRLEEESLQVANTEMERLQKLASRKASSAADLDNKQRAIIMQKQLVQSAKSKLNLLPTQIESAQAALKVAQANLAERQRDLRRCEIRAPFECRLGAVNLEVGQFITVGEKLFTAQSNDGFLIDAEFDSQDLRRLFDSNEAEATSSDDAPSRFQVDTKVRYRLGGGDNRCDGRFVRFRERLSDQTRSGIVVIETVADSEAGGPPPIRGTLCEIELTRRTAAIRIIVPLSVFQQPNSLFVLNEQQRLLRREVTVEFEQDNFAVIQSGLADGETVVVSQPHSAIDGSLVDPVIDESLQRAITVSATGSESPQ